jgi:hypothetical protein
MATLDTRSDHISTSRAQVAHSPCQVVRRIVSLNDGYARKTPSMARHRVSFCKDLQTRDVERRCDISDEEFSIAWYCKGEFHAMKKLALPILKKMAKNIPLESDEEPRGLEQKTPNGSKKRHRNRYVSVDAVLQEQDHQWERNRQDPEFLAEMYIQSSAHCMMQAYLNAKNDEDFVNKHVREVVDSNEGNGAESAGDDTPSNRAEPPSQPSVVFHDLRTQAILSAAA